MPSPKPPHATVPPSGAPEPRRRSLPPIDPQDFDVSEADIDAAIGACDGDARATIRALLVAYAMLEREMSQRASAGYSRSRKSDTPQP